MRSYGSLVPTWGRVFREMRLAECGGVLATVFLRCKLPFFPADCFRQGKHVGVGWRSTGEDGPWPANVPLFSHQSDEVREVSLESK